MMRRPGESGETLIELIFAITIIATAGVVFMTGIATAAISAHLQTSGAKATELVTSLGERAKQIPFIPCATADQYNDELDVEPLSGPRQPLPAGYDVEVTKVSYWTGATYEALDGAGCAALPPAKKTQLQRLDLEATGSKGVQQTLVVAKRGPLNIPTLSAPDAHPASPLTGTFGDSSLLLNDTITLTGLRDPSTGTVTFRLYGPDQLSDGVCTGTPIYQSDPPIPVLADATHPPYTYEATAPSSVVDRAGTYRWIASYTGDLINQAVTGVCDQTGQDTVVAPKLTLGGVPSLAKVGVALKGKATLAGTGAPTGTMTFHLYGPGDTSCANELIVPGSDHVAVTGNDTLTGDYVPSTTGVYRWRAEYSGDAKYAAVNVGCADAGTVTVKDAPTLAITTAAPPAAAPDPISATAQLTGGSSPDGTVTFDLYLGSGCTGDPIFTSADQPIADGGSDSGPSTATTANTTYSWQATYSGDAANAAATSACSADVAVPA
jgi:hypothetical protein